MSEYQDVYLTVSNGTESVTVYPKTCAIKESLCNENLQHEESSVTLTLNYEENVFKLLVLSGELDAVLYDSSGQRIFSGIINDQFSWEDLGDPYPAESLSVTIHDYTCRLDTKTALEIGYIGAELSVIINRICSDCGITPALSDTGITVPAFVLDPESSYKASIDTLLFQYGYTYFFDAAGALRIWNFRNIAYDAPTLDESEIFMRPKISRLNKRYGKVTVKYNALVKKPNELVYFSSSGYNSDGTAAPAVVQKNVYYPFESDPNIEVDSGKVCQNFESGYAESYKKYNGEIAYRRSTKTQLVYTQNQRVVEDWENGNITISRTDFGYRQAAVRLLNQGTEDAFVYSISIRADAWYREGEHSISAGSGKTEYTCEAEYVFTQESASALTNALTSYFYGLKYKIVTKTDRKIQRGTFARIRTGLSGFSVLAVAIASSLEVELGIYTTTFITLDDASLIPQRRTYSIYTTIRGEKGERGATGATGAQGPRGEPGKNGGYQKYEFAAGDYAMTEAQLAALIWTDAPPAVPEGKYLWMRTRWVEGA